ncbi:M28 family peptidase [Candidatus Magnetomoraceae bacterium gMMP-1]
MSQAIASEKGYDMIDIQKTAQNLEDHLHALTINIGERSVRTPEALQETVNYIQSFYKEIDLPVHTEPYQYQNFTVANVVSEIFFCSYPSKNYIIGAHYDSVAGTVGADDNASAIAVQLETARCLRELKNRDQLDLAVKFVSFTLEEPPAFGTRYMGSKVYAKKARKEKEKLDGMICLEMVGYTCHEPGCQEYPFPLMMMDYPKQGDFIGIVGDFNSGNLTASLFKAFKKNTKLPVIKLTVPLKGWLMPSVRLSDHASFWDEGFKSVMITDSAFYRNPHYHLPSDTMDKLDFNFMAQVVKSLVIFFSHH